MSTILDCVYGANSANMLYGGMTEWFKVPVLKTGERNSVGSNPTPSDFYSMLIQLLPEIIAPS